MPVQTKMPYVPLPDNPLCRKRIQITFILNSILIIMAITLNWDVLFHKQKNEYCSRNNAVVNYVKFNIEHKPTAGKIQMIITKDGETVAAKIINRFLGTINIYGALLDEEGFREKENELLLSDIDCEVCSYLYNNRIWYHILNVDSPFYSNGFTMTPISGRKYTIEYIDK